MKPSGPIKRKKALKRSTTPIRQVNPTAKAKRVKKQKAHYASAEYKAARKEAMERAQGQCEYTEVWTGLVISVVHTMRCEETEKLEAHHKSYAAGKKLTADHLIILCRHHHHFTEATQFSYRRRGK